MRHLRIHFLFLALCLLSGTIYAQEAIKVACIGNSITAGAGVQDRQNHGYPAILQRLLGEGYEVRNYGIGGRTLLKNGDRPYWNENYFTESQEWAPDIVVLKLGTNDSKPMNWDQHSIEFEGDLREMIQTYKNLPSHPKVYVCFPIWVVDDRMTIRESVIASEIIPIIQRVASETGVSVIDLHTTLYGMPQLLPDAVHPNELGYVIIAKDVYDRIK